MSPLKYVDGRTPPDGGAAPASPMAARCARWPSPAAPARPHDPFTQPPRYGARHSGETSMIYLVTAAALQCFTAGWLQVCQRPRAYRAARGRKGIC